MNDLEPAEYFANLVIEYMIGEWNKLHPAIEKNVLILLKKRYTQHLTHNQYVFIERAFGMPDDAKTYFNDPCDLINAIEMYKQETILKFWDNE